MMTSYTDTGLATGTTYIYSVETENGAMARGSWTGPFQATAP